VLETKNQADTLMSRSLIRHNSKQVTKELLNIVNHL